MQDQQLRTIKAHGRSNGPRALGRLEEVLEQLREIHNAGIGTTSRVMLKVAGKAMVQTGIRILARNDPPRMDCTECGKPGDWVCPPCGVRINYEHGLLRGMRTAAPVPGIPDARGQLPKNGRLRLHRADHAGRRPLARGKPERQVGNNPHA